MIRSIWGKIHFSYPWCFILDLYKRHIGLAKHYAEELRSSGKGWWFSEYWNQCHCFLVMAFRWCNRCWGWSYTLKRVLFGEQVRLTGWTDDNVIRNCSPAFVPGCTLINSFIGLCFPLAHDLDCEGSRARLHGDKRVFIYVEMSPISGPGETAQRIKD